MDNKGLNCNCEMEVVQIARFEEVNEEIKHPETKVDLLRMDGPVYTAGIDIGSSTVDIVVMNAKSKIIGRLIMPTETNDPSKLEEALKECLKQAWLRVEDLHAIVATGYGRKYTNITYSSITEITSHAIGAHYLNPKVRTVIDIGGQDSKIIVLDEEGKVIDFVLNDQCAAGTGRFLEMQGRALGLSYKELSKKGLEWKNNIKVTSACSVFAETEIIHLLAKNIDVADIIHGLNESIASRTYGLLTKCDHKPLYMMSGGVARNEGIVMALEKKIGKSILVDGDCQLCGAIGAALYGLKACEYANNR